MVKTKAKAKTKKENKKEVINFDADISQLMNLIINAFYSRDEIFIRELLSNCSDALEKIRYESLTNKSILDDEPELKITIWIDREENTINIEDTGVGMTKDELVTNLGTIAKSGAKKFLENIKSKEVDQIGQFGVGFYSSFLVSSKVKVISKNVNDDEYIWESDANKSFSITKNEKPELKRGTRVILYIKRDNDEYLETNVIREVAKKYTQFITFPISLLEEIPVYDDSDDDNNENNSEVEEIIDDNKVEIINDNDNSDSDSESYYKREHRKVTKEWKVINNLKPIWSYKSEEITERDYQKFYKHISNDYADAVAYKHFHAEGAFEFDCLIYIPKFLPYDFIEAEKKSCSLQLYVKKIFIMNNCDILLPDWLKFLKGVIDSNDIALNVSRELLQQNYILKQIKKTIVKKSIEMIYKIAENELKYVDFYDNYSKLIKLGIYEDTLNREKLIPLLRFNSFKSPKNYLSLDKYVSNMKSSQSLIYYLTGIDNESLSKSPFIENIVSNGYDVLYLTDPIDEYMIQHIRDYDGKKLLDVSKEGIKFNEYDFKKKIQENKLLIDFVKKTLFNKVHDVKISDKLKNTPCILTTSNSGYSANMERIIKAQALRSEESESSKKIFEVNIEHKVFKSINNKLKTRTQLDKCSNIILLLFETSLLNSGFILNKPSDYANKVNKMIEADIC